MITRTTFSILFLIVSFSFSFGQSDQDAVRQVVIDLFQKMNSSDTSGIADLFYADATLTSHYRKKGESKVTTQGNVISRWFEQIAKSEKGDLEERIEDIQVWQDDFLAMAWVPYEFYYQGNFSHCGTNVFHLKSENDDWKIYRIEDTRKKNCSALPSSTKSMLDDMVNKWHHAASKADEDYFFGLMKPAGIYIGTDASELWTAEEMEEWAKKYFQRDTAWHFTVKERNWYLASNRTVAWFDELLDTWMGVCRSSGVLEQKDGKWQLKHYHLSVTVPNEKIKEFIEICQD